MNISRISYNNFKGNLYRYIMYGLSNSLAVSVFFVFLNFTLHPCLQEKELYQYGVSSKAIEGTIKGLNLSMIIIVLFSLIFIAYSNSCFIKSRAKELGLYSLFGMTERQIRGLIRRENIILSLYAIGQGLVLGLIFSVLFFRIMGNLNGLSLKFMVSKKALIISMGIFFLVFEFINNLCLLKVKNHLIVQQVNMDKIPKALPQFSESKALIGILLLFLSYALAWFVEGEMVILAMIPISLLVILASYFIFSQFSTYLLSKIKKSKLIYNKINLIAYSQLIFKLKDTANIMFLSAIFLAVSFTGIETIYSFYRDAGSIFSFNNYEDLGLAYRVRDGGKDKYEGAKGLVASYGLSIKEEGELMFLRGKNLNKDQGLNTYENVLILSLSQYNSVREKAGEELLKLGPGESSFRHIDQGYNGYKKIGEKLPVKFINLQVGEISQSFTKVSEAYDPLISISSIGNPYMGEREMFIIDDERFNFFISKLGQEDTIYYSYYKFDDSKASYNLSTDIVETYEEDLGTYSKEYFSRILRRLYGTILFIGFFIAVIFFIASASVIYFKFFDEMERDRLDYSILVNIGMPVKDIRRIVNKELGIIFFMPFIIGSLHSFFALKSLSNLVNTNLIKNWLIVGLGYFIIEFIFFYLIKYLYLRKLNLTKV